MLHSGKYKSLMESIGKLTQRLNRPPPRVIVVSKTRTADEIKSVYDEGCRDFGQNYVQELVEKSQQLPKDIRWHFIGHLQSNKIRKILIPNLHMLHSVDSLSLADKIHKELAKTNANVQALVQIRTSNEQTKHGCEIPDAVSLAKHILKDCPLLKFKGLMTIGQQGDLAVFDELRQLREKLSQELSLPEDSMELSMGMSGDYEKAIQKGSTSVRVGTVVFGPRHYKAKPVA